MAERSKRRQWAAAAAQSEQDRSHLLAHLSAELDGWAAAEHRRLQPLQSLVWRALRTLATGAQRLWPSAHVQLFGSWASGLQLASSDVDLLVCGVPTEEQPHLLLRALAAHLTDQAWLVSIQLIETARVPLIKAAMELPPDVAERCGLDGPLQLDISLEGSGHSGVASTSLTRDVFCAHLHGLQTLVLVLKELLSSRNLNHAATGGLSSYALVLMAAFLLQQQAGLTSVTRGIGHTLVRFLEYFSALPETPDALHAVVLDSALRLQPKRVRRGKLLESTSSTGHQDDADAEYEASVYGSSLLVQDPLSHKFSNVSGTAFRWSLVQNCFREALQRLHNALQRSSDGGGEGLLLAALLEDAPLTVPPSK